MTRRPIRLHPRRLTPAERAVEQSGFTLREISRFVGRSPRGLARELAANHVACYAIAAQLAQLCKVGIWTFSSLALSRERWEEPR
jgi:hypothetical protein